MTAPVTIEEIHHAYARIRPHVVRTPVVVSEQLNDETHTGLFLKCENLQHVGAFKARGACNAVFSLNEDKLPNGVVTHSSGNHAAALARAATLRNMPAHIVMPHNSAQSKIANVRRFGVEPTFCEPDAESRQSTADRIQQETGATLIHPYNNPHVIAGQGTAAVELLEQTDSLDAVLVPVGGGGLLSGSLIVIKSINPGLQVFGVEPELADDAWRSLQSGRIEMPTRYDTIADGMRTPLGSITFPIIRDLVDEILLVSEDNIRAATRRLASAGKLIVEYSGATPLAAVMQHPDRFRGKRIGLILSGGNLDTPN